MRFNEALVSRTLKDLGYQRVKRHVYRALWGSTEVEHFLYFSIWGTPKHFMAADFGLRNSRAEAFGVRSILTHGGELYRLMKHDETNDCTIKFSLGKLAGWEPRSSIYLPDVTEADLATTLTASIRARMFPIVEHMTSANHLLAFLLTDSEPLIWARTDGAIRAAQIVDLARQCGVSENETREILLRFKREIAPHIVRAPDPDPEHFIDTLLSTPAPFEQGPHPSTSSG
jgi:hypothetical protein